MIRTQPWKTSGRPGQLTTLHTSPLSPATTCIGGRKRRRGERTDNGPEHTHMNTEYAQNQKLSSSGIYVNMYVYVYATTQSVSSQKKRYGDDIVMTNS